jgi:hypothetical protein
MATKLVGTITNMESRFHSIDTTSLNNFSYLRIKQTPISLATSSLFSQIVILPNTEESESLVVMVPKD